MTSRKVVSVKTRVLDCPRGGWMCLTAKWGIMITVPTVCQTWKCRRCGPKRKAYASMRSEHGSTSLKWPEPLRLITLTYRMTGPQDVQTALSALADFRRFVQLLRRKSVHKRFRWFRVPEVTRLGQIHWHVISGDVAGSKLEAERTIRDCWALATRRAGKVINHVVDASENSASGAASYVTKYLLKSALGFEALQERGFKRRWACSRDWTTPPKTTLRGTAEDAWLRTEFLGPKVSHEEVARGRRAAEVSRLADRVGDELVLSFQKRDQRRALAKQFQSILGGKK